jgi:hypothetical protein
MSNDRAQELTAKINQSITALCAETDAAKQSETYLAWLSTVSRFYKYSLAIAFSSGRKRPRRPALPGSTHGNHYADLRRRARPASASSAPIVRKVNEEKTAPQRRYPDPLVSVPCRSSLRNRQTANHSPS